MSRPGEGPEIELISPVPLSEELARERERRYTEVWPGKRLRIVGIDADEPLPERLNTADDVERVSRAYGARLGAGGRTRIADCMLDPGVEYATGPVSPGLFERIAGALAAKGSRVALASRNAAMRDRMRFLVARYGVDDAFPRCHDLDVPAEQAFVPEEWSRAIRSLRESGEDLPILACCTGIRFAPGTAEELDVLTPYELLAGIEEGESKE